MRAADDHWYLLAGSFTARKTFRYACALLIILIRRLDPFRLLLQPLLADTDVVRVYLGANVGASPGHFNPPPIVAVQAKGGADDLACPGQARQPILPGANGLLPFVQGLITAFGVVPVSPPRHPLVVPFAFCP